MENGIKFFRTGVFELQLIHIFVYGVKKNKNVNFYTCGYYFPLLNLQIIKSSYLSLITYGRKCRYYRITAQKSYKENQ